MEFTKAAKGLKGQLAVPGDKSISHRAVMLGSIASGNTEIHHFLQGADLSVHHFLLQAHGRRNREPRKYGVGSRQRHEGLSAPSGMLDCGNSGTTMRLMSGILAAQPFSSTLTGDASTQKRPMKRIMEPLTQMGAHISSLRENGCAPLRIKPGKLHGIHYHTPVASAQVKSAILLAGLYGDGPTKVTEPALSRNHTELMLRHFGAEITSEGVTAALMPAKELYGTKVDVPGDISSAAYFIAAALMVPGSEVLIRNVGVNPTRDGMIRVCQAMGADLTLENVRGREAEPMADLLVRHSSLKGVEIGGEIIPALIDELPMIAAMACAAQGTTVIKDAAELKVKESNRIRIMVENLSAMGADIRETEDGMIIEGGHPLHGASVDSHLDHRIAMTFAVTALIADGVTTIKDADCVRISYPGFYQDLSRLLEG